MAAPHLSAAERSTINITGYVIDAKLDPADHTLKATARVTFTATDTISAAIFELHNALKVDSVTDAQNHPLNGERGPNATISIALPSPMRKGASATLTFVYEGTLSGSEESPVEGLKVASIGDPISLPAVCGPLVPHGRLSDGPVYRGHPCADSERLPGGGQRQHRQPATGLRRHAGIQLQLDQAELSRHHHRGQVQ